jgi:TfoX/Sxy family transcriptional regulator of competence genes
MAMDKETIAFILDQLAPLPVRARAMFGGHALYCDEKVVALMDDDTLYVKPTPISGEYLGEETQAPPYPGAKDYYMVPGDRLEEREWLREFISRTADQLPAPKPKTTRKRTVTATGDPAQR